jgi:hypothetical protein
MVLMRAFPSFLLVQGMAAFLLPSTPFAPLTPAKASPVTRTTPLGTLRASLVEEKEAISAVKSWEGFPGSSRVVCAPQQSDTAVMSTFFKEVMSCPTGESMATLLVSPNCKSARNAEAMRRMAAYFRECCPWSDISLLDGAPHASFTFTSKKLEATSQLKKEILSEKEARLARCSASTHRRAAADPFELTLQQPHSSLPPHVHAAYRLARCR